MGWHYVQLKHFLSDSFRLHYVIVEVPSVQRVGENYFRTNKEIRYAQAIESCDVLLLSNVLQYIEDWVQFVTGFRHVGVKNVVLSKSYAYDGEPLVTNNIIMGRARPMHIFNEAELIAVFEKSGYRLMRRWLEDRPIRGVLSGRYLNIPQSPEMLFSAI